VAEDRDGTTYDSAFPFNDITPAEQMKPGRYGGWDCRACGKLIVPSAPREGRPIRFVEVKCPHCGKLQTRTWQGLSLTDYNLPN